MLKVLGIGDNVCDVYIHTNTMYPGGQAFNFAADAKILGADSALIAVHGDDAVGRHVIATMDARGIDHSRTRIYPGAENGFACVTLVDGDRVFKGSNKGGVLREHPIVLDESDLAYIAGFDAVHTTNNGFLDDQLPKLKGLGPLVSYDFSYRWNEEDRVQRVCPYIDFGFASCSDLKAGEIWKIAEHLHDAGCGVVVCTRGSDGAFCWDGVNRFRQLPHLVKPVDTMGAGDSFATALMLKAAEAVKEKGRDAWADPEFRKKVLKDGLEDAAVFSSQMCLIHGGSGDGIPIPKKMWPRITEISGISR